jgi:hypothetical protein
MPRLVRTSLWLLIGGFAVGLALTPFDPRPWPALPDRSTLITAIVLGIAILWLLLFIAWQTYQGRNWARWVQLITQVAATPSFVRDLGAHVGTAPIISCIYAVVFITEAAAVLLLFTPPANLWYHQSSIARSIT